MNMIKELEICHSIANQSYQYASQWKQDNQRKVIGYFCSYTPEEIISAAGMLPFRIIGGKHPISFADSHLQSYCCSLARSGLEEALRGELNFLDGTIFPHTCDTIQRLSDIWRLNTDYPFHIDIVLPVKLNTNSAWQYMIDVFITFKKECEQAFQQPIHNQALTESIICYNAIRSNMRQLYSLKSNAPDLLPGKDFHAILKSYMVMEKNEFLSHIIQIVATLKEKAKSFHQTPKKRLMVTGGICNYPEIYSLVENVGASIVWDDLCSGTRLFDGAMDETSDDPLREIAKRYYERVICPAKHKGKKYRGDHLVQLIKTHHCQGVIFLLLPFCDPHSFDYPYMKETLNKEQIPSLFIEMEESQQVEGQLKTRLEAFIEMI